jgi:hypothetical protein
MKPTDFLLVLAGITSANIIFTYVPLHCDKTYPYEYNGCLRGQECTEFGGYFNLTFLLRLETLILVYRCLPVERVSHSRSLHSDSKFEVQKSPVHSVDVTCGPRHWNTVCDPTTAGTCSSVCQTP